MSFFLFPRHFVIENSILLPITWATITITRAIFFLLLLLKNPWNYYYYNILLLPHVWSQVKKIFTNVLQNVLRGWTPQQVCNDVEGVPKPLYFLSKECFFHSVIIFIILWKTFWNILRIYWGNYAYEILRFWCPFSLKIYWRNYLCPWNIKKVLMCIIYHSICYKDTEQPR